MSVQPFTSFSDHKPLHLKLTFPSVADREFKHSCETYKSAPVRYKIDPASLSERFSLMNNTGTTNEPDKILTTHHSDETEEAYKLNREITRHIHDVANQCLRKTKIPSRHDFQ